MSSVPLTGPQLYVHHPFKEYGYNYGSDTIRDIYFLLFERSELEEKYSLIVSVWACMCGVCVCVCVCCKLYRWVVWSSSAGYSKWMPWGSSHSLSDSKCRAILLQVCIKVILVCPSSLLSFCSCLSHTCSCSLIRQRNRVDQRPIWTARSYR